MGFFIQMLFLETGYCDRVPP